MNAVSQLSAPTSTSGPFAFFTDRKIITKISVGFAAVLVLTAILAVMSYRGFGQVLEGFETYAQRVKVVGIAREVDRGFVAFRRFVREYSLTGDDKLIAEARTRQQALANSIRKWIDEIKNPERHKKMVEIGEECENDGKGFDKLI